MQADADRCIAGVAASEDLAARRDCAAQLRGAISGPFAQTLAPKLGCDVDISLGLSDVCVA